MTKHKYVFKGNTEIFFIILYKIILDNIYQTIQVPLFGYNGFILSNNLSRVILGWIVYILLFLLIQEKESDTSSLFCYTVFLVSITPFISLYQNDPKCKLWMLLSQCICLYGMRLFLFAGRKIDIKGTELSGIKYTNKTLRTGVLLLVLLYFLMTFRRFGVPSLRSLLFEEVYNTRAAVNLSTFQSIFQNSICRIVIPLSMLITFKEKKWLSFVILSLIQLYTYAVTGFKTFLFIPIVLIALQYKSEINLKKTIVLGLPIALSMLLVAYKITNNIMLYAILGNRVFFLPARIKYAYFDYFSQNSFVYFSQNSISRFLGVKSNYSMSVMNLIGQVYFNKPSMWTNTGFMADAYANLGFGGMALICIILSLILIFLYKQLRYVTKELQKPLQAIFVTFFISLNDGAAISVIFSGGLLFAVLVVCFVKFGDHNRIIGKR